VKSVPNPYAWKVILFGSLTAVTFGGGGYMNYMVDETNNDISKLEKEYDTAPTEATKLHNEIVDKRDDAKSYALYRNVFYAAGGISALFMSYYIYRYFTYKPPVETAGFIQAPLIMPVCYYSPGINNGSDNFFVGIGMTGRF
jgi:hypothetical protein